jgi:hypothetical protein
MLRYLCISLITLLLSRETLQAQSLQVSGNGRYLIRENGSPFFWLADTAWELTHRGTRDEIDYYLEKRKSQGFNVIQTVALAELDGLHTPNREGQTPLIDDDPAQPNPAYFEIIDYTLRKADSLGMFVALLPTWGDKLFKESWGTGPEVFTPETAYAYGKWIGHRFRKAQNLIWVLGGDRNPREGTADVEVWNQLADGILAGLDRPEKALMSFHPQPRRDGGSSHWFHQEPWLDFNMHQTGHCNTEPSYTKIRFDYALTPAKPVLDGEPLYEAHPLCFNAPEQGYSTAPEIRRIMYQNVFSGAFGQTYGCHAVWQMYSPERQPVNGPLGPWKKALDLPMANQVRYLKELMLSRPYLSRIPDQGLFARQPESAVDAPLATRDEAGTYAMVYLPDGKSVTLNLQALKGTRFRSWWYDPRTGAAFPGEILSGTEAPIVPPSSGKGQDWVLVVDEHQAGYPRPGQPFPQ